MACLLSIKIIAADWYLSSRLRQTCRATCKFSVKAATHSETNNPDWLPHNVAVYQATIPLRRCQLQTDYYNGPLQPASLARPRITRLPWQ